MTDTFRVLVAGKAIVWVWLERVETGRGRVPNADVVGIWVGDETEKQALIEMDPRVFFTEPHYNGYPAVLVRLREVEMSLLERLLTDAWRMRAPKRLTRGS